MQWGRQFDMPDLKDGNIGGKEIEVEETEGVIRSNFIRSTSLFDVHF
jgi:hypothetical protein